MNTYFIYDGRANFKPLEDCSVIECFQAKNNSLAIKYVQEHWDGYDCVLSDRTDVILWTSSRWGMCEKQKHDLKKELLKRLKY